MSLATRVKEFFFGSKELESSKAYDLWSLAYDAQPGNLMLDMDEEIFTDLLNRVTVYGKVVVDLGCGTGRHWKKIDMKSPARLIGFDVSAGMLEKLKEKFPKAETFRLDEDQLLRELPDSSVDLLVSTLTIAHIEDLESVFREWNRILK